MPDNARVMVELQKRGIPPTQQNVEQMSNMMYELTNSSIKPMDREQSNRLRNQSQFADWEDEAIDSYMESTDSSAPTPTEKPSAIPEQPTPNTNKMPMQKGSAPVPQMKGAVPDQSMQKNAPTNQSFPLPNQMESAEQSMNPSMGADASAAAIESQKDSLIKQMLQGMGVRIETEPFWNRKEGM